MLLKTGNVGVAFFGDGAVNNGAFHEGLNMAGVWKLPALFVCENNRYATEVPFAEAAGNPRVASRAASYGLPGIEVDGNDVLAVHAAAGEAIRRARAGGGATLIECLTYRTRPHSEGMGDFTYRTREEVEEWKTRLPDRAAPGENCSPKKSRTQMNSHGSTAKLPTSPKQRTNLPMAARRPIRQQQRRTSFLLSRKWRVPLRRLRHAS
jgi:transketolase